MKCKINVEKYCLIFSFLKSLQLIYRHFDNEQLKATSQHFSYRG